MDLSTTSPGLRTDVNHGKIIKFVNLSTTLGVPVGHGWANGKKSSLTPEILKELRD